jgi:uncharacterized membrane protein
MLIKTIGRTLIILLVAAAIGWTTIQIVQNTTQPGGARLGGERGFAPGPGLGDNGPRQGFRGEGREGGDFDRGGVFGLLGGLAGILGHAILFAAMTVLVVVIAKLLPKKTEPDEPSKT